MTQKVSVIIPTWNRAHTLQKTIESVCNQTYPVYEILVCDDGSDDESEALIAEMYLNDSRIKWIACGRNGRPAKPRNIGIKKASGDWLAFLDSDDTWREDKIEKQMNAALNINVLAICSNALRVIPKTTASPQEYFSFESGSFLFEELVEVNKIICSSTLIHKSILNQLPLFPENKEFTAIEDYSLWLKVATITNWYYLKEPLVNYTDNPSESVRAHDVTDAIQKERIYQEYLIWNGKNDYLKYKTVSKVLKKHLNKDKSVLYRLLSKLKK